MSCDKCGLNDPDCQCYLSEIAQRVTHLEEELDKLTFIVDSISKFIMSK